MRRLGLIIAVFAILAVVLVPSLAQGGGSIADIIESRSASGVEFTILQEFLDAAPNIRNRLDRAGNYTLFAPNDRAFRNLENAINLDLSELLADLDVVEAFLNYHLIDGLLTAQQLRQSDGRVIETELGGAYIGIRRAEDRTIVVNNVVEVQQENISASNGIIHEINDVLLNRVINELLDEKLRSTPEATVTPSPTSTPMITATATAQSISAANIRLAHFASDAPDIDLSISGNLTIEAVSYGSVSDFGSVTQGIYTVRIVSLDEDEDFDFELDLTLLNGDFVTIILLGSLENDSLDVVAHTEDFDDLDEDESRIMIYHAIEDAPAISLQIDEDFEAEGVTFSEFEIVDIPSGEFALRVVETRDDEALLLEAEEAQFLERAFYFIALYGSSDAPEFSIIETTAEDIQGLQRGQIATPIATGTSSVAEAPEDSIVEVLDADDEFTILVEAMGVADEGIINILGNPDADNVTFLAPTDQAFLNLLSTIGYSRTRLLANTDLLSDILLYHIIDDVLYAEDFLDASGMSIETHLEPSQALFVRTGSDGRVFLNGTIEFERTDILASNGIIHVIDDVLLPQAALEALGL